MAADEAFVSQRSRPGAVDVEIDAPLMATIFLSGECDISTAPQLADALALTHHSAHAIVDLSDCEFIDSTIVGVLATALNGTNARGGQLSIVLPPTASPIVKRIFDVMRLRDIFAVHESTKAARPALPEV